MRSRNAFDAERWMDPSKFWRGRRTLVLGCTGFLGTHVVRSLLEHGATVIGLIRDSQRPSEFFAERFHRRIRVVRGTADPQRLRTLIAVHEPAAVFQLASVSGQSHAKHRITADFLRAVARLSPALPVVVPIEAADTAVRFQNEPLGRMRVGFVRLPTLFGPGHASGSSWVSYAFSNASAGRVVPYPDRDESVLFAPDAAEALLETAEWLTQLAEPPSEGHWIHPPATTTTRVLYSRLVNRASVDLLDRKVERTLRWYERTAQRAVPAPLRSAA